MSTKVQRLVDRVNLEVTNYSDTFSVKSTVGDSVNNNRVPTVRQTIRYLKNSFFNSGLGYDLERVYTVLRQKNLFKKLRRNNNRTDAFDINELNTIVDRYVSRDPSLKAVLGRNIFNS